MDCRAAAFPFVDIREDRYLLEVPTGRDVGRLKGQLLWRKQTQERQSAFLPYDRRWGLCHHRSRVTNEQLFSLCPTIAAVQLAAAKRPARESRRPLGPSALQRAAWSWGFSPRLAA